MSSRCSEKLTKKGGNVTFTNKWARGIPKLLRWMKRGGKTARREMILTLYEELSFTWKRTITNAIFEHMKWFWSLINATWIYCAQAIFAEKGAQSVPITNVQCNCQITGTFFVNISGEFLPIQLIYSGVTDRCHPEVKFCGSFHITHSSNHCFNEPIVIDYRKKIIFPYL